MTEPSRRGGGDERRDRTGREVAGHQVGEHGRRREQDAFRTRPARPRSVRKTKPNRPAGTGRPARSAEDRGPRGSKPAAVAGEVAGVPERDVRVVAGLQTLREQETRRRPPARRPARSARPNSSARRRVQSANQKVRRLSRSRLNCGVGDRHHRHHAGLHGVGHDQVGGLGDAARHVEADDEDALLADLPDGLLDVPAHERAGENEDARPGAAPPRARRRQRRPPTAGSCPRDARPGCCAVRLRDRPSATWPTWAPPPMMMIRCHGSAGTS